MEISQKDHVLASHDQIRKLAHEHSLYSQRLENLAEKRYLSEDEKLEEVRLKKLKLRIKDQMAILEHQFGQRTGAA